MMDIEKQIKKKCKEAGVSPDVLTDEERAELIDEIKAEQKGYYILDGVLCNPDIYSRNLLEPHPHDRIVCVKVGKVVRENLYEMTRKYWKVKLEKASKATHVLAIVDGIVKAVYIPHEWKYTQDSGHLGRCEFVGKEDVNSDYIGKSVVYFYGFSSNPVKYIGDF